jgi:hypothetical protein
MATDITGSYTLSGGVLLRIISINHHNGLPKTVHDVKKVLEQL